MKRIDYQEDTDDILYQRESGASMDMGSMIQMAGRNEGLLLA